METCITDISRFDSTIPRDATQEVKVYKSYSTAKNIESRIVNEFLNRGLNKSGTRHKGVLITLNVDGFKQNEHSLANYETTIASATYSYDIENSLGFVGLIKVDRGLQNRGIGTQMKKMVNNHMEQDGADFGFTYVCSEGGRNLAHKTGYRTENKVFTNTNNVWYREF